MYTCTHAQVLEIKLQHLAIIYQIGQILAIGRLAQKVALKHHAHTTVSNDQNVLSLVILHHVVQKIEDTCYKIEQTFRMLKGLVGVGVPKFSGAHQHCRLPFELAKIAFGNAFVCDNLACIHHRLAGFQCPRQWGTKHRIKRYALERLRHLFCLGTSCVVKRDVRLALHQSQNVPLCLSMSNKVDHR